MEFPKVKTFFVILLTVILLIHYKKCDIPDICFDSSVTAIENVKFLNGIERLFVSSGRFYWFINQNTDQPVSDKAFKLPFGFEADVALIKDTRFCSNGEYTILLIQKKQLSGTMEHNWLTMEFKIKEWDDNNTNIGEWNKPQELAHCVKNQCTVTNKYFYDKIFDFKKSLDAAFGVVGGVAYFVQGTLIYNVTYRNRCVYCSFFDIFSRIVFVQLKIKTITSAAFIKEGNIFLFDNEFYSESLFDDSFSDKKELTWVKSAKSIFKSCSPFVGSLKKIIGYFYDRKTQSLSMTGIFAIILVFLILLFVLAAIDKYNFMKREF